jgi:hypothetical protein
MANAGGKFNVRNPAVKRIMQVGLACSNLVSRGLRDSTAAGADSVCCPLLAGDSGAADGELP